MNDELQGDLFVGPDMTKWTPEAVTRYEEIREAWLLFHARNPIVYEELCKIAFGLLDRGRSRYGISGLFEVLRWKRAMFTVADPDFKLNNNFRAFYARLLMASEPRLAGFFEVRKQISGGS